MKDSRFLELVNLYLDGEITEAETNELEREIRSSARRMDQYRRYCRMQKACMLLAEKGREEFEGQPHANVVRLPEVRRGWFPGQWWRGVVYGGTAAVAATVILVISMSGPGELPEAPAPENTASNSKLVQIPVNEFTRSNAPEIRLATLRERWSALTRRDAASNFQGQLASVPSTTPQFGQTPIITEWSSTSILPERGPLEFRYQTDSFSGARILQGQPRVTEGEIGFATFEFAR